MYAREGDSDAIGEGWQVVYSANIEPRVQPLVGEYVPKIFSSELFG